MLDDNFGVHLAHSFVALVVVTKGRVGVRILVSNALVEVVRPLLEFGLEVRPGRSVLPLVLVPLAVHTDLGGLKAVGSDLEQFVSFGVHHSRQAAGLECHEFDGRVGVEEFNGSETEGPAQVNGQEYHRVLGGVGQVVLFDELELAGGLEVLLGGVDGDGPCVIVRTRARRIGFCGSIAVIIFLAILVSLCFVLFSNTSVDVFPVDMLRFDGGVSHRPSLVHEDDSEDLGGWKHFGKNHAQVSLSGTQIDDCVLLFFLLQPRIGFHHFYNGVQDGDGLAKFLQHSIRLEDAFPQLGGFRIASSPFDKATGGLVKEVWIIFGKWVFCEAFSKDILEFFIARGGKIGKMQRRLSIIPLVAIVGACRSSVLSSEVLLFSFFGHCNAGIVSMGCPLDDGVSIKQLIIENGREWN